MPKALNASIQRSFGSGEIAPGLAARADLPLYGSALRTCRNFVVQKHGGAYYRNGTVLVAAVKTGRPNLLRYAYSAEHSYLLEVGAGYLRFFKNGAAIEVSGAAAYAGGTTYSIGAVVSSAGVNYWSRVDDNLGNTPASSADEWYAMTGSILEIPTPFLANLDLVRITQDLHVATLTHQDYPPQELTWLSASATSWRLAPVTTTPSIAAPANIVSTRGAAGDLNPVYVVTSRKIDTYEESLPSEPSLITLAAEPTDLAPNILTWDAVAGAAEWRVYKDPYGNGVYGFLGTTEGIEKFYDAGFAPDFGLTPPKARELFDDAGEYPHTAAYHQQRRVFANSHLQVATVWASQTGFPSNFSIRSPLQDDDAVTFTLAGPRVKGIQHLVSLDRLVAFTDGAEWVIHGDESSGVITPFDIHPDEIGWSGSAARPVPMVIGSTIIFTQYLSRVVRDLVLDGGAKGQSRDLTIFASHLFKSGIARQDVQIVPDSVAWFVRSDGVLLGLTYLPELEQYGWHRHDTAGGEFLDVCVIPEGATAAELQDYVYVLVDRDGTNYIERFAQRIVADEDDAEDVICVDAAVTYDGGSTTAISGLSHLNGETVWAWTKTAGGNIVQGPFTVSGGAVTLTTAATKAHVGLPITGQLETLALEGSADLRARRKRVQSVTVLVERSVPGFYIGPDEDHLEVSRREDWQSATALADTQFEVNVDARMHDEGRILIQHAKPSPLTVLGVIPIFEVGG